MRKKAGHSRVPGGRMSPANSVNWRAASALTSGCGYTSDSPGAHAALREQLHLGRFLEVVHEDEGLGNGAAHRQDAVVAQHQRVVRSQVAHQPLALARFQRHAFVVVEGRVALVAHRELAQRREAVGHGRNGGARVRMRVQHAQRIGPPRVNGAVDHEAGLVHFSLGVVHLVAVQVDLHQRRRRHFRKQQPVRVDQKVMLRPRHARRDVVVDEVVHAEVRHQPVAGGELHAQLGFGLRVCRGIALCHQRHHTSFWSTHTSTP
jgi:hypothetical protein